MGDAAIAGLKAGVFFKISMKLLHHGNLNVHLKNSKMQNDEREYHLQQWQSALKRARSDSLTTEKLFVK